jgi:murein tripeptide amidase MpaA
MKVSSNFDGGNIRVIACHDPNMVQLEIKKDKGSEFYQWFYFRLTGARDLDCTIKLTNAGDASYPDGWKEYRAVASYDREVWFRVPTTFDGKNLILSHKPTCDAAYYAYFAPYSMERHADLVARTLCSPHARLTVLGESLDGAQLDLLRIGGGNLSRAVCWIIGRQHPGETMAEWWMEGFLSRLLDDHDSVAHALRTAATFYVVPNMNPDGSRRGHLRCNAAGVNLNREWAEPSLERSPEVFHVRQKMEETGVDFCLDVHGDEILPYNFIAGSQGIPSFTAHQSDLLQRYKSALRQANPDFQTERGYPISKPGKANLSMAGNYVAEFFGCLAMTLEQPFKDAANSPDPAYGWSPVRCRRMGHSNLDAILAVVNDLR